MAKFKHVLIVERDSFCANQLVEVLQAKRLADDIHITYDLDQALMAMGSESHFDLILYGGITPVEVTVLLFRSLAKCNEEQQSKSAQGPQKKKVHYFYSKDAFQKVFNQPEPPKLQLKTQAATA